MVAIYGPQERLFPAAKGKKTTVDSANIATKLGSRHTAADVCEIITSTGRNRV
jgi:hypothetical protein